MKHEAIIYGQPPSKSNSYRIVTIKGHGALAKTAAMKDYEQKFFLQCPYRGKKINGFFELYIDVYFHSNLPDLDNALKVILDCLQTCKAINNDRQCVKIVAQKFIDKNNPRIEFTLKIADGVEIKDSAMPTLFN